MQSNIPRYLPLVKMLAVFMGITIVIVFALIVLVLSGLLTRADNAPQTRVLALPEECTHADVGRQTVVAHCGEVQILIGLRQNGNESYRLIVPLPPSESVHRQ